MKLGRKVIMALFIVMLTVSTAFAIRLMNGGWDIGYTCKLCDKAVKKWTGPSNTIDCDVKGVLNSASLGIDVWRHPLKPAYTINIGELIVCKDCYNKYQSIILGSVENKVQEIRKRHPELIKQNKEELKQLQLKERSEKIKQLQKQIEELQ